MSIKLKGSTDGSVTLQAPADTSPTGTDKTFTLPTQDGDAGQILKTDGSGALSFTDNLSSGRNLFINGAMTISERGTSFSSSHNNNKYGLDRWFVIVPNTSATLVHSQESSGGPDGFKYWLKASPSVVDTDIGSNNFGFIEQKIEGYNFAPARFGYSDAKTLTLSFRFKTNKAGTYCWMLRNASANRNLIHEFTPVADGSWQTISFAIPGDTGGSWDTVNGIGLMCSLSVANGSSLQSSTTDTWFQGQYFHSTPNQVNFLDSTSNELGITGCQIEIGEAATEFEHRNHGDELARCQRYFQHSFQGAPGTGNTSNDGIVSVGGGTTGSTTSFLGTGRIEFSPNMRADPTITIFDLANPRNTGKCMRHTYGLAGTNNSSVGAHDINTKSFVVRSDGGANASGFIFHYQAEAEL